MREIKFRMWNPETKVMVDLKKITPLAVHPELLEQNLDGLFIPFKEGYPLMQFTGLLDKNGKEIYEGDILKYVGYTCRECNQKVLYPNHKPYIVSWSDIDLGWSCDEVGIVEENRNYMLPSVWKEEMEVIGNIYENPELLG